MKIASAVVNLASTHTLSEEQTRAESLRLWVGNERPVFAGEEKPAAAQVRISPEGRQHQQAAAPPPLVAGDAAATTQPDVSPPEDPKLKIMRLILEALTGRKIRITGFAPVSSVNANLSPDAAQGANPADSPPARQGWGLEYNLAETASEEESLNFSATGQVATTDGKTIDLQLQLAMHREFTATNSVQIRGGDARLVDPLVINLNNKGVELSGGRFAFDLNANGKAEQISGLAPGSGFLALDRNQDGKINNGLELFGPASGQGFAELAQLDSDGNGWIDENDPLYAKLQVWMRDEAGKDSLTSLAQNNVGAILLSPAKTPFALKDSGNGLQGQLRESAIFLGEAGGAGTVQEVDLAV
ncbi:MAG: VCBS repeat-containing protein [Desulfurivibrionaceae bacterium]